MYVWVWFASWTSEWKWNRRRRVVPLKHEICPHERNPLYASDSWIEQTRQIYKYFNGDYPYSMGMCTSSKHRTFLLSDFLLCWIRNTVVSRAICYFLNCLSPWQQNSHKTFETTRVCPKMSEASFFKSKSQLIDYQGTVCNLTLAEEESESTFCSKQLHPLCYRAMQT